MIKKYSELARCINEMNFLELNREQKKDLFYGNICCIDREILMEKIELVKQKDLRGDEAYQYIKVNLSNEYRQMFIEMRMDSDF